MNKRSLNIIAVIGARLNSSRLPGKHLRTLGDKPLIQHVYDRLCKCNQLNKIILATTADRFNQPLVDWAYTENVPHLTFSGDVNNLVGRIDSVFEQEKPDYLVYICGDSPLVDPEFIDHAVASLAAEEKKETIKLKEGIQTLHEGMGFYSADGWRRLVQNSTDAMTKEHVGYANVRSPFLNTLEIEDSNDYSKTSHRISVDTEADLKFMREVYRIWYERNEYDSIVNLKWLHDVLVNDPKLKSINQHVNQKDPEIVYEKISIFCHVSKDIGLGHVSRCAKIANSLQESLSLGTHIHILGDERSLPWLNTQTTWYNDHHNFFESLAGNSTALSVIDLHPGFIDMPLLRDAIERYKDNNHGKLVSIDKLDALLDLSDKLFVPSFFSKLGDTKETSKKVSFGWDHYFIEPNPKNVFEKQITVLTGGSDALRFGEYLPSLLDSIIPEGWDKIWVQGPYAKPPCIDSKQKWEVIKNPDKLQDIISRSEIVLSAYGLSLFESLAHSGSVIVLPPQHLCSKEELEALAKSDCCLVCNDPQNISEYLEQLIGHNGLRLKLRNNASNYFTSRNGSFHFCKMICTLLNRPT